MMYLLNRAIHRQLTDRVADVVQRIEHAKNIHAVLGGFRDKAVDDRARLGAEPLRLVST